MASCIQIEALVQAYIDGELCGSERLSFEEHTRSCRHCNRMLQEAKTSTAFLFETLRADRLNEDLRGAVMAHLPEMERIRFAEGVVFRHVYPEPAPPRRWLRPAARLMPVFAPVVLLVLAALLWTTWPTLKGEGGRVIGMITYRAGAAFVGHASQSGQKRAGLRDAAVEGAVLETLEDGGLLVGLAGPSSLAMFNNTQARLENEREVVLNRGRVFLDVAPDSRRFQVTTPDGRITVMGTSFHVDLSKGGTEVTVINGQVLVENDAAFALLSKGSQASFSASNKPEVRHNVNVARFLNEARAMGPDPGAQRQFLTEVAGKGPHVAPLREQVFVVDTQRRPVSAVTLEWLPDPYTVGHAGYNVYVSDSAMAPLFKAHIPPETFQNKQRNSIRIAAPSNAREHIASVLHITLIPNLSDGLVETSFTDVSAIGKP